jgi:hypothetical protein
VENQMIQLWVLPDEAGEPADYRVYEEKPGERQHVYGGPKDQDDTFYSRTSIDIVSANAGQSFSQQGEVMAYLPKGRGRANGIDLEARTLVRANGLEFEATDSSQLILIFENVD